MATTIEELQALTRTAKMDLLKRELASVKKLFGGIASKVRSVAKAVRSAFATLTGTVQSLGLDTAFVAHLKEAQFYLGQALVPILNAMLPTLTRMSAALASAAQWVAAFSQALFGGGDQTQATEAQTAAVGGLGAAYEKAGKKAEGSLAGFDQLNLIETSPGSEGAGGAADAGRQTGAFKGVSDTFSNASATAREMANKVKSAYGEMTAFIQEHSDLMISALAGVGAALATAFMIANWGSIVAIVQRAGMAIAAAIGAISWPIALIVAAVGLLVGAFVYFYRTNEEFRETVHTILQRIGETATWLWQNVMVPFGEWLGAGMVIAWQAVTIAAMWLWDNVLKPFGAWLVDVMPIAWKSVATAAGWLWEHVLVPFGGFLQWLWESVLVPISQVLSDVLAIAFDGVAKIAQSLWQNVLVPLGNALAEMLGPAVEAVSAVLTFLWKRVLEPLGTFIKTIIMPIIEGLIDVFVWLWDNVLQPFANFVKDVLAAVFDSTFRSIGNVVDGVKDIFIGLMQFITGVFTGDWAKAWNGVVEIFKGIFDTIGAIVTFPLNLIIDSINSVIRGLNKININVPDWVPGFGGMSFGISIPQIPRLNVGTNYVPRDGFAFLHEGEAVVPKAYNPAVGGGDNRETIRMLERVEKAVKELKYIQAVIGQDAVGKAASGYIVDESRRGRNPIAPAL